MPEFSISVNKFSINESRTANYVNMESFKKPDILEQISANIRRSDMKNLKRLDHDKAVQLGSLMECVQVSKDKRPYFKYLFFTVLYGEFGTNADIVDIPTGESVFDLNPNHAPMRPYHVFVAYPYGAAASQGIAIFENIGGSGVKSIVTETLANCIKIIDDRFVLKVTSIAPYEHAKNIVDTFPIKRLKLIHYNEDEDAVNRPYDKKEIIFTRPLFHNLQQTVSTMFRNGHCNNTGIAEIDAFEPNDIRVVFDFAGKEKTIGVMNIETLGLVEYITTHDDIQYDEGNLPTTKSLKKIFMQIFNEYNKFLS